MCTATGAQVEHCRFGSFRQLVAKMTVFAKLASLSLWLEFLMLPFWHLLTV
jgi:hypothetical protein